VKKLKDKPFALVGVHVGGSTAKQLAATMEKEKLPWRSFVDPGNAGTGPISVKWNFPPHADVLPDRSQGDHSPQVDGRSGR
jgi:hypothetical protein